MGGLEAGQSDEGHLDKKSEVLQRPYGAQSHLFTAFPTLKRGASHHCAYGAINIGTSLVNNLMRFSFQIVITRLSVPDRGCGNTPSVPGFPVDHGDHYAFELEADRIAAAYWSEHDRSVIAHQTAIFGAILKKWPNPIPPGQDAQSFLNANIDVLVPTRDYIWFQAQMCLTAFSQKPIPSFNKALTLTNSH